MSKKGTLLFLDVFSFNPSSSRTRKLPTEELANESRSTHITVAADMVFSLSHFLSGVNTPLFPTILQLNLIDVDSYC